VETPFAKKKLSPSSRNKCRIPGWHFSHSTKTFYSRSGSARKLVYAVIYRSIYALYLQLDSRDGGRHGQGNPGATSAACCLFVKFNWRLGQASAFHFPPFELGSISDLDLYLDLQTPRAIRLKSKSELGGKIQF